jgi:hypothetical protein
LGNLRGVSMTKKHTLLLMSGPLLLAAVVVTFLYRESLFPQLPDSDTNAFLAAAQSDAPRIQDSSLQASAANVLEGESPVVVESESSPPLPVHELNENPSDKSGSLQADIMNAISDIQKLPGTINRDAEYMHLGEMLGAEDFDTSLTLLMEMEDVPAHALRTVFYGLFTSKASHDAQGALEALADIRDGKPDVFAMSMNGLAKGWGRVDLQAALEFAYSQDDRSVAQAMALRGVYRAWGEQDGASASASVLSGESGLPRNLRFMVMQQIAHGWARTDPLASLAFAQSFDDSPNKQLWLASIANALSYENDWGVGNESDTAAWLIQNFPQSVQRKALPALYDRWMVNDPEAAFEHAASVGAEQLQKPDNLIGGLLGTWYVMDPQEAITWADYLRENVPDYQNVLQEVVQSMSDSHPRAAAEFLNRYPELLSENRGLLAGLVPRLTADNPHEAVSWAVSLSDEESRRYAVKAAYASWARTDDMGSALLSAFGLPSGNDRAYALSNVAVAQGGAGFIDEATWISDLPSGFTRDRSAAGFVLGTLRRKDPRAASVVKQALGDYEVNMTRVEQAVQSARIDSGLRTQLLDLVRIP